MAVNKVVFGAVSIMDITDSTVTKETLAEGVTAYDKSGEKITGTMKQATPKTQEKTVTPTTSQQSVTPDSGYDGLSKVTVNAMPTATQATPSITVSSAGLITAKATQSAGYVASGTKSATKQLTVQAAKTITPSTSSQTAVASGRYTTGAVTVAAIPSTYVKPTATKSATTYTPSTSNQTIAAGTYCSGVQTIKGDANLKAENIKSGVTIFGVSGAAETGEDVTDETNAYTTKLASLETAITALETELAGKASGGSGGGGGVSTCTVTVTLINSGGDLFTIGYHALNDNGEIEYTQMTDINNKTASVICVCGTAVEVQAGVNLSMYTYSIINGTVIEGSSMRYLFTVGAGEICQLTLTELSGGSDNS